MRHQMREAFPGQSQDAARLAAEWLGRPFRDHVNSVRVASGREQPRDWTVEMRGAPDMLQDPNQSFIIATGHFSREAMTVLYLPSVLPQRLATVVAPLTQEKSPHGTRVRVQMRAIRKGIERVRNGDVYIADVAGRAFLVRLLHHLRAPGGAVIIATDAAWHGEKGEGYTRPFAGLTSQAFALGTARLARMSQRPIVTCVPFLDGDRRVVMEWSPVIQPPARDDASADVRITDEILDWIERRIGARPGQYVLGFGRERRWSAVAQCWVGADDEIVTPQTTPASSVKSAS
jgi:lauroyl/myristoyl acyltransferase